MKLNDRTGTVLYSVIQSLYWISYGMMFSFASKYLQGCGFEVSRIGLCLAACYGFSVLLQLAFGRFFSHTGRRLNTGLATLCLAVVMFSVLLALTDLGMLVTGILFVADLAVFSALQPSINSLQKAQLKQGVRINFSLARGIGSLSFSVMCFLVGNLLTSMNSGYMPFLYAGTVFLLAVSLLLFRTPEMYGGTESGEQSGRMNLPDYPSFAIFLGGIVLLSLAHIFVDVFMLQIFQNLGGDTAQQGTAAAIAGITELPGMLLYSKLSRKAGTGRLLFLAGWLWVIKTVTICFAKSFSMAYCSMALQLVSYAVYVPAAVDFVSRTLPEKFFLRGQALSGSAFTIGSLLATLAGGMLISRLGIADSLIIMTVVSACGAMLLTFSTMKISKNNFSK